MKSRGLLSAVAMTAFLFGCVTAQREGVSVPSPASQESTASAEDAEESEELIVTGVLEPTVERGGWILKSDDQMLLLLGIADYRREPWFKAGSRVKVWGSKSPETMTTFMQGTPFKVNRIEPVSDETR